MSWHLHNWFSWTHPSCCSLLFLNCFCFCFLRFCFVLVFVFLSLHVIGVPSFHTCLYRQIWTLSFWVWGVCVCLCIRRREGKKGEKGRMRRELEYRREPVKIMVKVHFSKMFIFRIIYIHFFLILCSNSSCQYLNPPFEKFWGKNTAWDVPFQEILF